MRSDAHIALALALSFLLFFPVCIVCIIMAIAYSTIPDYDVRHKHRKLLHNIIAMFLLTSPALFFGELAYLGALVGYGSHLLGDMLTVRGVALFYPFSSKHFRLAKFKSSSHSLNLGMEIVSVLTILLKLHLLSHPT
jgi:inner membrane protein